MACNAPQMDQVFHQHLDGIKWVDTYKAAGLFNVEEALVYDFRASEELQDKWCSVPNTGEHCKLAKCTDPVTSVT